MIGTPTQVGATRRYYAFESFDVCDVDCGSI